MSEKKNGMKSQNNFSNSLKANIFLKENIAVKDGAH